MAVPSGIVKKGAAIMRAELHRARGDRSLGDSSGLSWPLECPGKALIRVPTGPNEGEDEESELPGRINPGNG